MAARRFAPLATLALASIAGLAVPRSARSLPLFSRSLDAACARCHGMLPSLNATGIAFAERGFRVAGHEVVSIGQARGVPLSVVGRSRSTPAGWS